MVKKRLVFIKLGGSLITDKSKPYKDKTKTIARLAKSFCEVLKSSTDTLFIIGNGAGSFGHYAASIHDHHTPFGFSFVQQKVKQLNSIIVDSLLRNNISSVSFPFSSIATSKGEEVASVYLDSLIGCLRRGIVPSVYGDVIYDPEKGATIFSTEKIFSILIDRLDKEFLIERVIHLTIVDGVLDDQKNVIPHITNENHKSINKHFYRTRGYDVTGGMHHKVEESLSLTKKGIITNIANGELARVLERILLKQEQIGTEISSK